ncbi:MAG TPA: TatD family hydrolase [Candidatus Acidoferrum sp.]|nr:TatD family hydrolase [Candidatus Acidoferrum sp.]
MARLIVPLLAIFTLAALAPAASAADYAGPLIDAHSHVSSATAIDAYAAAMKRHDVRRVLLLGVGGVQKDDPAWIAAAAKKYPDRVLAGVVVPDPMAPDANIRLEQALARVKAHAIGEIHLRQVSRKIDRDPTAAAFTRVLETAAKHGLPVIVHDELNERATAALGEALAGHPKTMIVLAHAGEAPPAKLEPLLTRHPNLVVDLSGMHFQRTPALATETGHLDPAWKALIEKMPDRFVIGIDVWAPKLFEPAMLDRLMKWTRRILGELSPAVAEQVAYKNAVKLYRAE